MLIPKQTLITSCKYEIPAFLLFIDFLLNALKKFFDRNDIRKDMLCPNRGRENRRLRQIHRIEAGDQLSTVLFYRQLLTYSDGMMQLTRNEKELKRIAESLMTATKKVELPINEEKRQYISIAVKTLNT